MRWAVIAGVVSVLLAVGSAAGAQTAETFSITSTLDGKSVLPHRIHWVATFHIPRAEVTNWAFQIDGKTRWIGNVFPAAYADGNGFLVTSWLTPGMHTFTVRAYAKGGRSGVDSVSARVTATPPPPAVLAGAWTRIVDPTSGPNITPGHKAPAGTYRIVFDKRWIQDRLPGAFSRVSSGSSGSGAIIDNDWNATGARSFHVQGDVVSFPPTAHVNRETGNSWCFPGGPAAEYTWRVTADQLTLTPRGRDDCALRGFIWTGTWARAS